MRIRSLVLGTLYAAGVSAQGSDQGFNWVGLQAGSHGFEAQTNLKTTPFFGIQGGRVFEQQRFGLSLEATTSHPKSDLLPGTTLSHSSLSVTHLTGFRADSSSQFWPYFGQGLGVISLPKISPGAERKTITAGEVHVALGFLHRLGAGFIWGVEGRYVFAFAKPDFKETRGAVMVGLTWGGRSRSSRPTPTMPPPLVVTPPVESAAPRPEPSLAPVPSVRPVPPALPRPMVAAAPPQPSPVSASPEPAPPPPPPTETIVPPVTARPVAVAPVPLPPPPRPIPAPTRPTVSEVHPMDSNSERTMRLDALRQGDMAKAVELGRRHFESIPANRWTIRLVIANLPSTLKNAVEAFPVGAPDLFIAPLGLKGGKTAYQLFLADYASKADADRAAKAVPPLFLAEGQRPKALPVSSIALPPARPDAIRATPGLPNPVPIIPPPPGVSQPAVVLPTPPAVPVPSKPALPGEPRTGVAPDLARRLEALRLGDMTTALELGRKHLEALPPNRWTIRLEIANLTATLQQAVKAFPGAEPDLFIAPFRLRSGKTAYQLFLSDYASKVEAEQAAKRVPPFFLEGGQRPKPFPVRSIPTQ